MAKEGKRAENRLIDDLILHLLAILVAVMATLAVLQWSKLLDRTPRIVIFDEVEAILAFSDALPEGLSEAAFKSAVAGFQTEMPFLVQDYAEIHRVAVLGKDALRGAAPNISGAIARMGQR